MINYQPNYSRGISLLQKAYNETFRKEELPDLKKLDTALLYLGEVLPCAWNICSLADETLSVLNTDLLSSLRQGVPSIEGEWQEEHIAEKLDTAIERMSRLVEFLDAWQKKKRWLDMDALCPDDRLIRTVSAVAKGYVDYRHDRSRMPDYAGLWGLDPMQDVFAVVGTMRALSEADFLDECLTIMHRDACNFISWIKSEIDTYKFPQELFVRLKGISSSLQGNLGDLQRTLSGEDIYMSAVAPDPGFTIPGGPFSRTAENSYRQLKI